MTPEDLAGARIKRCVFWERLLKELVVHQAQYVWKERSLSRCHALNVIQKRLGILFSKILVEELGFHFDYRFVTRGV